jgi:PAS domain S-box-containing protein
MSAGLIAALALAIVLVGLAVIVAAVVLQTHQATRPVPVVRVLGPILETADEAMVVSGDHGVIKLVNHHAEQLFGYARGRMVGLPLVELVPERYRAAHLHAYARFWDDPHERELGPVWGRRADGTEFPCTVGLAPVSGIRVLAVIREVKP